MPRFVALDWDDRQVRAVFANQQGTSLSVDGAMTIPLDQAEPGKQFENLVDTIRKAVTDRRYRSAEAIVTIRRADVELRLLNLPPVPEEEVPDIVRFQAMQDFSEISEDWPIDFLQIDTSPDEMTVLAAAVSKSRVEEFRETIRRSDLKPQSLVLRPCAAASLVQHQEDLPHERVQLMVDEFGSALELTVLTDQTATFIRTVQQPSAGHRLTYLAGEIRRTIIAAQNQLGGDQVQQVILFGSGREHSEFCTELEGKLNLPVHSIDPFSGLQLGRELRQEMPANPERFAAALGLLINQVDQQSAVLDFFNPRRVEPPKSKRPLIVGAATAALVVMVLIAGGCWWYLRSIDKAIVKVQIESQKQRTAVETAQKRLDEYAAVKDWLRRDINWLDQLKEVSEELPEAKKTMIRDFSTRVVSSGNGVMTLEGVADQQGTIYQIERDLSDDIHRVTGDGGLNEEQVPDYPWRFKETIVIQTGDPKARRPNRAPANRSVYSRAPRINRATP